MKDKDIKKEEERINKNVDKQLPKSIKDPKTGRTYKRGRDYSSHTELQPLCTHQKLEKLGYSFYICPTCKVILQVPLTLQYSYSMIIKHWDEVITNLKPYFEDEKSDKENTKKK